MTDKKEEASHFNIGTDLLRQAAYHVAFLKVVNEESALKNPHTLKRAFYRYEKYWLPLAAENSKECLSAPLDIEWIWHCHMLCPKAYETDCQAVVGLTVNHTLHLTEKVREKQTESQKLWTRKYGNEEPFTIDFLAAYDVDKIEKFQSKITYDVVSAAQRQVVFFYQVSLPHYTDFKYLEKSLLRYKQFLYLKTKHPKEFLVPCYDIDLMWHTHQLNPLIYKTDMINIIGHLFDHDDTVNDRSEGSKLYNADKQTRESWTHLYNEPFSLFGAMFRGDPSQGFLYKVTPEDCYWFCTKRCKISMDKFVLTFPKATAVINKKLKFYAYTMMGTRTVNWIFKIKRPTEFQRPNTFIWKNIGQYNFNAQYEDNIKFSVYEKISLGLCGSGTPFLGSAAVNMIQEVESKTNAATGGKVKAQVKMSPEMQLDVECSFSPPTKGNCLLYLHRGRYETMGIPENIKQLWRPGSLERLASDKDNLCQVASHRMKNHRGEEVFTVKTIHSQALIMSAIQVYYQDKMSVIGHLVSSDQLPLPTQVTRDQITLDPKQGERALLLKNSEGDWGILTGRWRGFRNGVAGTRQRLGQPGSPGTLYLRFYKMSTGRTVSLQLGYLKRNFVFYLDSAKVDLMNGTIVIEPIRNEIAENIALAFSVSLLHVLLVPRPKEWKEGMRVKPTVTSRGSRTVTTIPSDDMAFIVAAGLHWSTPSNQYMHSNYGSQICAMCGGGGGDIMEIDGDWGDTSGGEAGCDGSACCGGDGDGGGCGGCGGCGGGGGDGGDGGGCGGCGGG